MANLGHLDLFLYAKYTTSSLMVVQLNRHALLSAQRSGTPPENDNALPAFDNRKGRFSNYPDPIGNQKAKSILTVPTMLTSPGSMGEDSVAVGYLQDSGNVDTCGLGENFRFVLSVGHRFGQHFIFVFL